MQVAWLLASTEGPAKHYLLSSFCCIISNAWSHVENLPTSKQSDHISYIMSLNFDILYAIFCHILYIHSASLPCGRNFVKRFELPHVGIPPPGPRALYKGFLLHQVLWIPFNAIFWPLYEGSKAGLERRCGAEGKPSPSWIVPLSALVCTLKLLL
jgi:hypothetical protein